MVQQRTALSPELVPPISPVPADALQGDIAVQFLTTVEEFAHLAPQWNRLHDVADVASIFNSWIWLYRWWQVYGAGRDLRLVVALQEGEVVGILPLYLQTTRVMRVPVRMLRFVGTGGDTHPDDLGPIIAPHREEEIALKLAQAALRISDADILVFPDIDPRSRFPRVLEQAAAHARRRCFVSESERIAYLDVPDTWQAFLKSLTSDRRTRLKSARKKACAGHAVRFFVWDDAVRLDEAVDRLVELHRSRWRELGGSESFASAQYVDFHRGIIKASFARGWLRLYCLEMDGGIAAMTYCYRFRKRVYLMQAGFDPAKARVNPGKVLLGYAIEHAIGEGNEVFDFLRGEHRYKEELATGHRMTRCVSIFRATLGSFAYRLRRIWLPLLKARLRRRPPPPLRV